jgi:enamine deaminase RidA (YjgF/YER057c/UK114 family)
MKYFECMLLILGPLLLFGVFALAHGAESSPQTPKADGPEARLRQLGIALPPAPKPVATYVTSLQVGNLLYVSGHGPVESDGTPVRGKVGRDMSIEQGQAAARNTGLLILSTVREALGSLDNVVRVVKVLGFVNAPEDFDQQPQVINGFSNLMVEIFGETAGKAPRSAVGAGSLPAGIPVEIEAVFEVRTTD